MGVKSGRLAALDGVSTLASWSLEQTSNPASFVTGNMQNGTGRQRGPKDWTGNYACKGGNPIKLPGEYFDFLGLCSPSDDEEFSANGGTGVCYSGRAIVDEVAITWNYETNDTIAHTVKFSADGELVEDVDTVADATDPDVPASIDNLVLLGTGDDDEGSGSASGADLPLTTVTLTITAANVAYLNAQTALWTRRKPGPAVDWTLAAAMHEESGINLPFVLGDDIEVTCPVGSAGDWLLRWGHVLSFTGITVDRTSGAIIAQTVNLSMNGWKGSSLGYIKKPGGTTFWPGT